MLTSDWFFEDDMPLATAFKIKRSLYSIQSKYQKIDVLESVKMGNILLLDNKVMVTEKDEFYYHETITHTALSIHPNPVKVLVIGGGDGGTIREVLKYKTINQIDLVEIDEEVINVSKKFFPDVAKELNNSKVKIKVNDAIEFIKSTPEATYDAILCDSTDPEGFAVGLISKDFYKDIGNSLKDKGIFICQSGSVLIQEKEFETALENLRTSFKYVDAIVSTIPSYPGALWSFLIASNSPFDKKVKNIPAGQTKYWSQELQEKLFIKPNWLQEKYFSLSLKT